MNQAELNNLKEHVSAVATLILGKNSIGEFSSDVTDRKAFDRFQVNQWLGEYICIVEIEAFHFNTELLQQFSNFLRKSIFSFDNKFIFWFEFEYEHNEHEMPENKNRDEVVKLHSDTRLPNWLDNYLFNDLEAQHLPDFKRFSSNLELEQEELKMYLGTYFPRSYAESFCIFNELMQNTLYKECIENSDYIYILDIGCGTGGNLLGVLQSIKKNSDKSPIIKIYAIDGNEDALKFLEKLVEKFKQKNHLRIELETILAVISSPEHLQSILNSLDVDVWSIIMSSKMVGEFIQSDERFNDFYLKITEMCLPLLIDTGLFFLLDVTTKADDGIYLPIMLNTQVNQILRQNTDYKTLSPNCCSVHSDSCSVECFNQQLFRVSHSRKRNDISKVTYRLIGHNEFVTELLADVPIGNAVIHWKLGPEGYVIHNSCPHTSHNELYTDAYKLHQ